MTRSSRSIPGTSAKSDIVLSPDMLILHLIATGIIRSATQIARGKLMDREYSISLQLGLDRLNVVRYRQQLPLIKSVPDLLLWCQRPLKEWPLNYQEIQLNPEDRLLIGEFPTEICDNLACATSDVEAELSEKRFMERVFSICRDDNNPQAYTDFRRLLIEKPVLTALELLQCRDTYPNLEILENLLEEAYQEAPLHYMVQGTFSCCPNCGNLLQRSLTRNEFLCEDERCRATAYSRKFINRERILQARDRIYWLRRDLRRFVMMPGRAELRLEKRLLAMDEKNIKVEMWPNFDRYDLRITLPKKVLAIDVKDWASPFLLAYKVKGIPGSNEWDQAYYVFPQERKTTQPDYVSAFTNICNNRGQISIGGNIKAAFENDFLKVVRKALQGENNAN
ncbi:MAG TPA: hypothetical protein VNG51_11675 [Ktedonobacteraceae bacterium]|nr:hypothetical protein [Ktedonobacteraceae bacterium]